MGPYDPREDLGFYSKRKRESLEVWDSGGTCSTRMSLAAVWRIDHASLNSLKAWKLHHYCC